MSAFVVLDKTIHAVIAAIIDLDRDYPYQFKKLVALGYADDPPGAWKDKLATDLHTMNVDAVNARYADHEPEQPERLRFPRTAYFTPIQKYKSLTCLIYQCSEGDIPKRPLYQYLERDLLPALSEAIITALPAYDKATWG